MLMLVGFWFMFFCVVVAWLSGLCGIFRGLVCVRSRAPRGFVVLVLAFPVL